MFLIGAILSIPLFYNTYQTSLSPVWSKIIIRFGFITTRQMVFGLLAPLVLIVFLIFFPRKNGSAWKKNYLFALALVLTPFIVLNQQIITGQNIFVAHYHWYFIVPLSGIILVVCLFHWLNKSKKKYLKEGAGLLLIGLSIYTGLFIQHSSYAHFEAQTLSEQRYGPILEWLDKNGELDQVVFVDKKLSQFIPMYTSLNSSYHVTAKYYLSVTDERLLDSIFLYYRLDGLRQSESRKVFFRDRAEISSVMFATYYRELTGSYEGIPDELLEEYIGLYQAIFSSSTPDYLKFLWQKYKVDYVIWDSHLHPIWQLDQYNFLNLLYQSQDLKIYCFLE